MDSWMSEWFLFPGLFIWRCDCAPIVHGTKNNISLYTARFPELAKMNIPLHQVDMANITWGWSSSYPQEPKNHCTLQRRWVWMCVFCGVFLDLQFPPVTWDPSLGMPMKEMRFFSHKKLTGAVIKTHNPDMNHWKNYGLLWRDPWILRPMAANEPTSRFRKRWVSFFIPNKSPNQPGSLFFFCGAERVSSLEENHGNKSISTPAKFPEIFSRISQPLLFF